jgi:putative ABC transport system permease protein
MRWPTWRRRQDRLLAEELQSHLELATQDRIERGESPAQAAAAARREFGNELLIRETVRDVCGWTAIEEFWRDLAYARRALSRAPAFLLAAVLTLGLGIGANTAMFSVVRAVVLRPLPFPDADRLVAVNEVDLRGSTARVGSASWPNFFDWRRDTRTLQALAAHRATDVTVTGLGPARHVPGAVVSANLFSTLGVFPADGRSFREEDDHAGADVVIVSDEFRREQMGDGEDAVGRRLGINGRSMIVVGVMPPGFRFPVVSPPPQVWLTASEDARVEAPGDVPITDQRGAHLIQVVGRLRAGVSVPAAQQDFERMMTGLAETIPGENAHRTARVTPELEAIVGTARRPLLLLLAAVSLVLLIACVNLATLVTARGVARQPELALRAALGASRTRIVRLLLAEAVALAGVSAAVGVGVAWASVGVLVRLAPRDLRGLDSIALDPVVLAYTAATAAACAVLVGLAPALSVTRRDARRDMSGRGATGTRGQRRWLDGLVVAESGLGVVLLVAAALVVAGLSDLNRTAPGFDVTSVTSMHLSLPDAKYPYTAQLAFYDRLLPELARLPGAEGVAIVGPLPLSGSRYSISVELPPNATPDSVPRPSAVFAFVSPGYFAAMRIPLERGRVFSASDTDQSARVVVVNAAFARRYFPGEDPIGERIKPGLSTTEPDTPWREIVGVVSDVKVARLNEEASPAFYVPYTQGLITSPHIVVRASRQVEAMPEAVRQVVARADPELALYDVRTMHDRLVASMAAERFTTLLLTLFAALGLVLTAVGLYGVLAYAVTERTREFGLRLALGARPGQIVGGVLRGAFRLLGAGLLIGIGASMMLTRAMTSALDFVHQPDAATFATVAAVLTGVALTAAAMPARRAMRVDPIQTLRSE